ncbi:MAG: hypothetical protein R3A44_12725 [Caldilineaceae bacterium]
MTTITSPSTATPAWPTPKIGPSVLKRMAGVQPVSTAWMAPPIQAAIATAQADPRPSIIGCKTIIGYGSPTYQGASIHSDAVGEEELARVRATLGFRRQPLRTRMQSRPPPNSLLPPVRQPGRV